jgi:hypothetical protein
MKFLIWALVLGAALPNEIRVLKCVGVFNHGRVTRGLGLYKTGWSSRVQFNLSKICLWTLQQATYNVQSKQQDCIEFSPTKGCNRCQAVNAMHATLCA